MPNQVSPPHDFFVNQPHLEPEPGWQNQPTVYVQSEEEFAGVAEAPEDADFEEADYEEEVDEDELDSGEPVDGDPAEEPVSVEEAAEGSDVEE
jgi:hypothetical protein